jgi:transposase InsO family protein
VECRNADTHWDLADSAANRRGPNSRTSLRTPRERQFKFLLHDRDTKLCLDFDAVFRSEGMRIIRTPMPAPNANAHAERWVGTLRRDCLDRILILNRRHLDHVLRVSVDHYNLHRPHRSLSLQPPTARAATAVRAPTPRIDRRELLGGLINEYRAAA